jgi:G3E family GTPase
MAQSDQRIPVTVLTGFLGAGKTTLLNRIMTEQHGKRIAIIQNEFGEIGIDGALVINADEEIFEMNNGCICCTVRGDLIRILGNLMKRKHRFDYVLIETDGLADPAPVAQTFFVDPEMQESWKLDGIVTIVDAKHVDMHWETNSEVKEQIAFADVILLNKTDLVPAAEVSLIERKIRSINTMAKIHKTNRSELPVNQVLDIAGFDLNRILDIRPQFLEPEVPFEWAGVFNLQQGCHQLNLFTGPDPTMDIVLIPVADVDEPSLFKGREEAVMLFSNDNFTKVENGFSLTPGHLLYELQAENPLNLTVEIPFMGKWMLFSQHHPSEYQLNLEKDGVPIKPVWFKEYNPEHLHDSEISSVSIEFRGDLDYHKINNWISNLLREKGVDIFRMKGIISIKNQMDRFVFHGVHMLFTGIPERPWGSKERINQMVFVGRNLSSEELNSGLKACLA